MAKCRQRHTVILLTILRIISEGEDVEMDEFNQDTPYFEAVSLCIKNDSTEWWRQWTRVADIADEKLCECQFDDDEQENANEQKYAFSKRYALPHKVRQYFEKGELAVFAWSDAPDPDRPDKIKTSVTLLSQTPILVIPLHASTAKQAVDMLHEGVPDGSTSYDVIYTLVPSATGMGLGLLCQSMDMECQNGTYRLKLSVSKLPYYNLGKKDIVTIQELRKYPELPSYAFLRKMNPGVPDGTILAKDALEIVKNRILTNQKMSWSSFRDFTARTNNELRLFKAFLQNVTGKDLYQEIADDIGCSVETAQKYVEGFIANANEYLDGTEIDTDILSKLIEANDTLRTKYTQQVEERWKQEAKEKIEQANKELQQVRQDQKNCTRTLDETKHQIELAKKHLAELQGTIQENERIAQDSYRLVQDKLASTKANVAEFLAEMSLYMPISANGTNNSPKSATIHHGDRLDEEVVDLVDDYNIVMAELADNLSSCAGITKERSHHLHMARFLYATHLRHQSLLLAGLNSEEIAQTLSATIYGRYADVLVCTEDYDEKASSEAMQGEGILLVRNPFCGDWLQNLLRDMATSHKQIIFCHPYTEDLSIEPESLFQYLIPVFTTDFVEHQAEIVDATGTILAPDGKAFVPSTKPGLRRDWLDSLKISSMMQKKIQGILSDVAVMAEADDMNNATAAFEYTLLPYAAVTRKGEQFCKRIQESNSVPTEVKSHIYHFFDYEEE